MSYNRSLEEAVKIAVESTPGICKKELTGLLVVFNGVTPILYQDSSSSELIQQATLNKINYKLKLVAGHYKNDIKKFSSEHCIRLKMTSHTVMLAIAEWEDFAKHCGFPSDHTENTTF